MHLRHMTRQELPRSFLRNFNDTASILVYPASSSPAVNELALASIISVACPGVDFKWLGFLTSGLHVVGTNINQCPGYA